MQDIVNCRNLSIEDNEDDPWNVNIPEFEGEHVVAGPALGTVDVTKPLKLKEFKIGIEEQPKLAKIGDYWDDDTIGNIVELLTEYHDLFPTKFFELKVIVGDLGVIRITLKPDACLFKQLPYWLNPKYKKKFKEELDRMVIAGIIEPIE